MPAVSVIIPTHDRLDMLREALDSVAQQSVHATEVIVVDDGSSENIAAGVADHPARPRVLRQPQLGPAAARNHGLREARADFVAFLDSDDLWRPEKLERFWEALHGRSDNPILYGPMSPIDAARRPVAGRTKPCHDGWITRSLFASSFVHVPTVFCARKTLLDAGGFDERLPVCEDYDLWLRLSVDHPFALIDEPLALRRLHDHRLSKGCMSRNLAVKAEVLRRFFETAPAQQVLDRTQAMDRLARAYFTAARAAYHNCEYEKSVVLCDLARQYGGGLSRLLPLRCAAAARRWLAGAPQERDASGLSRASETLSCTCRTAPVPAGQTSADEAH